MDTPVIAGGLVLEHPIMNGAGLCKDMHHAEPLIRPSNAALVFGSITTEALPGNEGDVYFSAPKLYSLNSLGLPNRGAEFYRTALTEIVALAHSRGRKVILSVAGATPQEFAKLCALARAVGVDAVELNIACPNRWDGATQKRIICFDPNLVGTILMTVAPTIGGLLPMWVKLSPILDPVLLGEVSDVISACTFVRAVVTSNTAPNSFAWKETTGEARTAGRKRRRAITPGNGLAGMSGPALKPIALGQVRQLRDRLPSSIDVIGVGGICSGQDVIDYLDAGAAAVQVVTAVIENGPGIFDQLYEEYTDLLEGDDNADSDTEA